MNSVAQAQIRVFVLDDHPIVQHGVTLLATRDGRLRVVGHGRSLAPALRELHRLGPDLVLLDLRLPGHAVAESLRRVRAAAPDGRILVFTAHADHPSAEQALRAGAHGVLLKDVGEADLVEAMLRAARGEVVLDPRLRPGPAGRGSATGPTQLTKREYEIIRRVALGETNPEIAKSLALSRNTVKTYLQHALQKLGARNRIEAIIRAGEAGLL
jgi:DNA-binding NarL/FixJ family response regulator